MGSTPSGYVAFIAHLHASLTGLGHNQIVRFDDVILNRGSGYDALLGVFRCTEAGTYQFSLSIGSYGGIQLEMVNNGVQIGRVFTSRSRYGRDTESVDVDSQEDEDVDEHGIAKRAGMYAECLITFQPLCTTA